MEKTEKINFVKTDLQITVNSSKTHQKALLIGQNIFRLGEFALCLLDDTLPEGNYEIILKPLDK